MESESSIARREVDVTLQLLRYLGLPTAELLEAVAAEGTAALLAALPSCDVRTVHQLAAHCTPISAHADVAEAIFRRASACVLLAGISRLCQLHI